MALYARSAFLAQYHAENFLYFMTLAQAAAERELTVYDPNIGEISPSFSPSDTGRALSLFRLYRKVYLAHLFSIGERPRTSMEPGEIFLVREHEIEPR